MHTIRSALLHLTSLCLLNMISDTLGLEKVENVCHPFSPQAFGVVHAHTKQIIVYLTSRPFPKYTMKMSRSLLADAEKDLLEVLSHNPEHVKAHFLLAELLYLRCVRACRRAGGQACVHACLCASVCACARVTACLRCIINFSFYSSVAFANYRHGACYTRLCAFHLRMVFGAPVALRYAPQHRETRKT